jgi:hypothetical protein
LAWDIKLGRLFLVDYRRQFGTASPSLGLKVEKDFWRGPENATMG